MGLTKPDDAALVVGGTIKFRAPEHAHASGTPTSRVSRFRHLRVPRIERSLLAKKNYRALLPPEQSIFPDLAYHPPKGKAKNTATVATANATGKKKEKKKD